MQYLCIVSFCSYMVTAHEFNNMPGNEAVIGIVRGGGSLNMTHHASDPDLISDSVHLWVSPSIDFHCKLPKLEEAKEGLSLDYVDGHLVECHGDACRLLYHGKWHFLQNTRESRRFHSSAVVGTHLLLVGGEDSPDSAEMMPMNGGVSLFSFVLEPPRSHHCSINLQGEIILTGGFDSHRGVYQSVNKYTGLNNENGTEAILLPSLITGRVDHACGWYPLEDDNQALIVAGGSVVTDGTWRLLDSTEIFIPQKSCWVESTKLPTPRTLSGAMIENLFYVFDGSSGDRDEEILIWDPSQNLWNRTDSYMEGRLRSGFTTFTAPSIDHFPCVKPDVSNGDETTANPLGDIYCIGVGCAWYWNMKARMEAEKEAARTNVSIEDQSPGPWLPNGLCGENNPFNNKPGRCDPRPEQAMFCCSNYGYCGNTAKHCDCIDCIDYSDTNGCSELRMDYPGNDINLQTGRNDDQRDSAAECQLLCQQTEGCYYYTWTPWKDCFLKSAISYKKDLTYKAISGPAFCPGTRTGGYFRSPNYPKNYPNNLNKVYPLSVAPKNQIKLKFGLFDLQKETEKGSCVYDWLQVIDGDGTELLGKTCGTNRPLSIISKTHYVEVKFHTDGNVSHSGFQIEWEIVIGNIIAMTADDEFSLFEGYPDINVPNTHLTPDSIIGFGSNWKRTYYFTISRPGTITVKVIDKRGIGGLILSGINNEIITNSTWKCGFDDDDYEPPRYIQSYLRSFRQATEIGQNGNSPWVKMIRISDDAKWIWVTETGAPPPNGWNAQGDPYVWVSQPYTLTCYTNV